MLCTKCSQNMHLANMSHCKLCGGSVTSGSFKLCNPCSTKLDECKACRVNLTADKQNNAKK